MAETFSFSDHALRTALAKGFTSDQILSALHSPEKVTNVRKYPGQKRFIGSGIAVVVAPRGSGWMVVTMYLDGVLTPPRADQTDPAGKRYAARYAAGLGRG